MESIKTLLVAEELTLAKYATQLADWFGKGRELAENHTGLSPVEDAFVSVLIGKITKSHEAIKELSKQVALEKELF